MNPILLQFFCFSGVSNHADGSVKFQRRKCKISAAQLSSFMRRIHPELLTIEDIVESITLVGIKVPYGGIYGGRSIGISFDCIWDSENGLGIRLCDETIIDVGYQDIAI